MNEEEKFDDLLRSKLTEHHIPFDEVNWDKAEALIERSEKRRRFGIIAAIFSAGIIVGIAIMFPFIHTTPSPVAKAIIQPGNIVEPANIDDKGNNTKEVENKNAVEKQTATLNNKTISPSSDSQNKQNASITNNSTPSTNSSQSLASVTNSAVVESNSSTQGLAAGSNASIKNSKHPSNSKLDTSTLYSYVRPESNKKNHSKYNKTLTTNNNIPVTSIVPNSSSNKNKDTPNSSTIVNDKVSTTASGSLTTNNTNTPSEQPTSINAPKSSIVTDSAKQITATSDSTKLFVDIKNTKKDSNTNIISPNNTSVQSTQNKYSHTLLSIDAGGGYSLGWQKAGATQGSGLSPLIGFSVTHYFSTKISAYVGLQYNSLGNINTLYTNNTTQYDFGYTTTVNSVTLKTLYYIALPIKFQYSLNAKNMLSAGVSILYLLNTNSTIVSYNQNYFGVSGNTATTKMGYTDGINSTDAQLTLAYRRKLNSFTLTAEGYYGLLDIESNSFFNNNVFERNSGLRLILSYDIIK